MAAQSLEVSKAKMDGALSMLEGGTVEGIPAHGEGLELEGL